MSPEVCNALFAVGGTLFGAFVCWMCMQHLNQIVNFSKEEVLQAQQIVLDGLNEAKHILQKSLLSGNKETLKALDAFNREMAGAERVLLELQNFAVNDDLGPEDLSDEARAVYDKVKNFF